MSAPCDVLVLAAFDLELEPLALVLGDEMSGDIGGMLVAARVVGIGLPMAAVGAAMQLGGPKPLAVLGIGTCGAYAASGLVRGEVVVPRRIRLVAPSELDGLSQFPEPMALTIDAHAPIADAISRTTGARPVDVATTLAITTHDATAARIAQATGAHVEHLELYGVAAACAAAGIPFGAVLAVANVVGVRAREEWRIHHREAARAAADVAAKWLKEGGLPDPPLVARAHLAR